MKNKNFNIQIKLILLLLFLLLTKKSIAQNTITNSTTSHNCNVSNGVVSGSCKLKTEDLIVSGYVEENNVIPNITVMNNGILVFQGVCLGNINVHKGGHLILKGSVGGVVTNEGGLVEIRGIAPNVYAKQGETIIYGIVDNLLGDGKVIRKKGATISGIGY